MTQPSTDTYLGINVPAPSTLSKYGLSLAEWKAIVKRQGGVCGVCGRKPNKGRSVIDHQHVPRWKHMEADDRRRYVRGVCCVTCNHFVLTRYGTIEKFEGAAKYMRDYEERRAQDGSRT